MWCNSYRWQFYDGNLRWSLWWKFKITSLFDEGFLSNEKRHQSLTISVGHGSRHLKSTMNQLCSRLVTSGHYTVRTETTKVRIRWSKRWTKMNFLRLSAIDHEWQDSPRLWSQCDPHLSPVTGKQCVRQMTGGKAHHNNPFKLERIQIDLHGSDYLDRKASR